MEARIACARQYTAIEADQKYAFMDAIRSTAQSHVSYTRRCAEVRTAAAPLVLSCARLLAAMRVRTLFYTGCQTPSVHKGSGAMPSTQVWCVAAHMHWLHAQVSGWAGLSCCVAETPLPHRPCDL